MKNLYLLVFILSVFIEVKADTSLVSRSTPIIKNKVSKADSAANNIVIDFKDWDKRIQSFDHSDTWFKTYFFPILLALIAGLVALMQVQQNSITNARIEWIERLRQNLSELITEIEQVQATFKVFKQFYGKAGHDAEANAAGKLLREQVRSISTLSYKITLQLNSSEEKHALLTYSLEKLKKHSATEEYDAATIKLIDLIIDIARCILKEEWEHTKRPFTFWYYKYFGRGKKASDQFTSEISKMNKEKGKN